MPNRSLMLPVIMVISIAFLAAVAIMSGRSNEPEVAGNTTYPHHVCTFNSYCAGDVCSREPRSFVLYLEHADGKPRLELEGTNPVVTRRNISEGMVFETAFGGEIAASLTIYNDLGLNFTGTSAGVEVPTEHYGIGKCDRLKTP